MEICKVLFPCISVVPCPMNWLSYLIMFCLTIRFCLARSLVSVRFRRSTPFVFPVERLQDNVRQKIRILLHLTKVCDVKALQLEVGMNLPALKIFLVHI